MLLVDNGSKPQRGGELREKFPQIEVLQLEENQGFSGGANRGMERALELGAQYLHVIGNDSTLAKDTISLIVDEFETSVDTGAASPILLNPGEPKIVQFYEATVDRDIAQHIHLRVGERYSPERFPTTESAFIPMVAVMFRSKALLEIGLLDEEFGTCREDYDLCMRLQNAGWRYKTIGAAQAKHIGSHTTGKQSPYILYYTTRNRLICLRRHANPGYWRRRFWDLVRSFGHQFKVNGVLNFSANYAMLRGMFDYAFKIRGETQGNLTRLDAREYHQNDNSLSSKLMSKCSDKAGRFSFRYK